MSRVSRVAVLLGLVAGATAAVAWNPISTTSNGVARRWDTAGFPIVWNPDGGTFGMLSNVDAVAMVSDQFGVWEAVPSSTISYAQGGQIVDGTGSPVDVTSANYAEIIGLDNEQHPIIFDNDRDIFDLLGFSDSVAGFAGFLQSSGTTILKGYAVLQGDCFDGDPDDVCGERSEARVRGLFTHEFGHFSGLGHSSVNHELEGGSGIQGCSAPGPEFRETMSPVTNDFVGDLHHDDVVGISFLYPTAAFGSDLGSIRGRLIDRDGATGFSGANMVLRPAPPASCDDRYALGQAMQSGVMPGEFDGAGSYEFQGLAPSADFTLLATTIADGYSYEIDPPMLPGGDDWYNGADEEFFDPPDDPAVVGTVTGGAAGATIAGVDVKINSPGFPGTLGVSGVDLLRVDPVSGFLPPRPLILDDGSSEGSNGFFGTAQAAWINRFTPAPDELPFRLERIDIQFSSSTIAAGRPIRLLVYTDPAGTGEPARATLIHTEDTTIQMLSSTVFNEYTLSGPLTIQAGDFYVGAFDLLDDPEDTFIARRDQDNLVSRSFWQANSTDPASYILRPDRTWMIRAHGSVELPDGAVEITWPPACNEAGVPGQDYAVYEGDLASLATDPDHAAIACGTQGQTSLSVLEPGTGSRFWLVAPLLATREGSLGSGSAGAPRTPEASCETIEHDLCP